MKILAVLSFIAAGAFAQPNPRFTYMLDVYALSPYGDVAPVNPMWWASDDSAAWVAARLKATPVLHETTPQTGPAFRWWHVAHVPNNSGLLPPMGFRQQDPNKIKLLMDLPTAKMWAVMFSNGCEVNAGYLENYYQRNSNASDGGDSQVRRIAASECGGGFGMSMLKLPGRGVKRLFGSHRYPSVWADGKRHKRPRRR